MGTLTLAAVSWLAKVVNFGSTTKQSVFSNSWGALDSKVPSALPNLMENWCISINMASFALTRLSPVSTDLPRNASSRGCLHDETNSFMFSIVSRCSLSNAACTFACSLRSSWSWFNCPTKESRFGLGSFGGSNKRWRMYRCRMPTAKKTGRSKQNAAVKMKRTVRKLTMNPPKVTWPSLTSWIMG